MAQINIININTHTFQVTVIAESTTTHMVTVQAEYLQKLTAGKLSSIDLIRHSFKFLLARKSNTSILRSFDLSVIAHYFPEFEREIAASDFS